jgi:hypothetical protein
MAVLWDFVRVDPQVRGQSKDNRIEVRGCIEENCSWGHVSEENRCALDACFCEV